MKKEYTKYLLSLLLFGSNGVVASLIHLGSREIVLARTLVGSLFLAAVFFISRQKLRGLHNPKHLMLVGLSGAALGASWMFLYEAYTRIGVSLATLAYYCGPVIVMAVSPVVFHQRMSGIKALGLVTVLAGMALVNGGAILREGFSFGWLCGMMAAVLYAVMVIANKKATGIAGMENALDQLVASFVTVLVFTLLGRGTPEAVPGTAWLPMLWLGVVNTGVGCYLYFSSSQRLPASTVAICGYVEPLSAILFSAAFLGERLTSVQWLGAALVPGGAAFGELYHRGAVERRTAEVPAATTIGTLHTGHARL